jgi:hypothetical protein
MNTTLGLRLTVKHQLVPKSGLEMHECEDSIGMKRQARRFCVSDGATEGFDSRRWARVLTKSWINSSRAILTKEQLERWLHELGGRFGGRWQKRSLPWYAEEKAQRGAFATFAGLTFSDSADGWSWQAIAIGDSCLIHRRGERILCAFPLSDPSEFGYFPALLPSDVRRQDAATAHLHFMNGTGEDGDVFLLLTDAIAAWYLAAFKSNRETVDAFESLLDSEDVDTFHQFITACRKDGSLRNDDVAVIRITIGETPDEVDDRESDHY